MAMLRVRSPKAPPADVDLGPCHGRTHAYGRMRMPIDVAIAHGAKLPPVGHQTTNVLVEVVYR